MEIDWNLMKGELKVSMADLSIQITR